MSQPQSSWDNLIKTWNTNDESLNQELPSDQDLINQINSHNRNQKFSTIISLVASIALGSYITFEIYLGLPSIADTILYSVFLALSVSVALYSLFSTTVMNKVSTQNTQTHLMVLLGQYKHGLRALDFSRVICAIALLMAVLLLGIIIFVAVNKTLEPKHYLVGGVALSCSVLFIGIFSWLKKQKSYLENQRKALNNHLI